MYQYARHLCSIDWGVSICLLYLCTVIEIAILDHYMSVAM